MVQKLGEQGREKPGAAQGVVRLNRTRSMNRKSFSSPSSSSSCC